MKTPNSSAKRFLASASGVIILLVIVAAVGAHVMIPLREHIGLQEEVRELRGRLAIASELTPLHLSLQRMVVDDEWPQLQRAIPQPIERQGIIRVPTLLVELAEAQGTQLLSVNPSIEATPRGRRLFVDLEVRGEFGALQQLLLAIADLPYFEMYTEIAMRRGDASDVLRGQCVLFVE